MDAVMLKSHLAESESKIRLNDAMAKYWSRREPTTPNQIDHYADFGGFGKFTGKRQPGSHAALTQTKRNVLPAMAKSGAKAGVIPREQWTFSRSQNAYYLEPSEEFKQQIEEMLVSE